MLFVTRHSAVPSSPLAGHEPIDRATRPRRFSLRALLAWVGMASLSFGMFHWAARLDSPFLWYLGVSCFGLSAILALVALQRCWRYMIAVFAILLVTYAGVYVTLSANGRYEPAAWGLNGVKWYAWAPAGFVRDFAWDSRMVIAFAPLYYLDQRFWHTERESESGRYPINLVQE